MYIALTNRSSVFLEKIMNFDNALLVKNFNKKHKNGMFTSFNRQEIYHFKHQEYILALKEGEEM